MKDNNEKNIALLPDPKSGMFETLENLTFDDKERI